MGNQTSNYSHGGGDNPVGAIVGFGVLFGVGWAIWGLFAISLFMGAGAILFVALCIYLLIHLGALPALAKGLAGTAFVLAIAGMLLLYPLAIDNHVVPYTIMGWTITGLFYAGLLAGAWLVISALGRVLAMIGAAAAVAAMVVLPAPDGAADPADKSNEWSVELTVLNEKGDPMKNAVAQCSAAMFWQKDEPVTFDFELSRLTGDDGTAKFTFHEDTRLKAAVCTALRENDRDDYHDMRPQEEEFKTALYPPKTVSMASPFPGGDYKLTVQLERRKQSDDQAAQP